MPHDFAIPKMTCGKGFSAEKRLTGPASVSRMLQRDRREKEFR